MTIDSKFDTETKLEIPDDSELCMNILCERSKLKFLKLSIPNEIKNLIDSRIDSLPGYSYINKETNEIERMGFLDTKINDFCKLRGLLNYENMIFHKN